MICVNLLEDSKPTYVFSISDVSYMTLAKLSTCMTVSRVGTKTDGLLIPPDIMMDGEAYYSFMKSVDLAKKTAKRLKDVYDMDEDTASYVIPAACPVSANVTVNIDTLNAASLPDGWEAQEIVRMIKEIINGRLND